MDVAITVAEGPMQRKAARIGAEGRGFAGRIWSNRGVLPPGGAATKGPSDPTQ